MKTPKILIPKIIYPADFSPQEYAKWYQKYTQEVVSKVPNIKEQAVAINKLKKK